ncbi:MAG: GAF domain-containing protein [Desulfuromonadaceae bacterium]|jgi:hypothetical protein
MKIAEFCVEFAAQIGKLQTEEERLSYVAKTLVRVFKLAADEVAIFAFDAKTEMVSFIWPTYLRQTGAIPLSSKSSLVVRTVKNRRGYMDNQFFHSAHTFIFEAVADPQTSGGKPKPIQKVLSVPMLVDDAIKGAIQLSRKGPSSQEAGSDFTQPELDSLQQLANVVGRHL